MSKFGPFTISTRERSRLAWRARVDAAAREAKQMAFVHALGVRTSQCHGCIALREHRNALAAPKPWRSTRKPDPRRRYSRSHRRACWRCKRVTCWVAEAKWARKCGRPEYRRFVNRELIWFRRNPHGRSDR